MSESSFARSLLITISNTSDWATEKLLNLYASETSQYQSIETRGGDLAGTAGFGPLQNFRWRGLRCLYPQTISTVFPTVRTDSFVVFIELKLQYYVEIAYNFVFISSLK